MKSATTIKKVRPFLALVAVCCALIVSPLSAARENSGETLNLSFGLYTSSKPSTMVKKFRPIVKLLEQRMAERLGKNVNIRMQLAKDYQQGIAHLTTGKVDFAQFGPASYVEAKKSNAALKVLAVERSGEHKVFYGIVATHLKSNIDSVSDLAGHSFAFGDQQSTIGRYLSQQFLADHGVGAQSLSHFEYLGRHDTVGTRIGAGDFAAGALDEPTFRKLLSEGEPIRELARFPNVARPWIARAELDEEVAIALKHCLLSLENNSALDPLKIDGFMDGMDSDFDVIRLAIDDNERFFDLNLKQTNAADDDVSGTSTEVTDLVSVEN